MSIYHQQKWAHSIVQPMNNNGYTPITMQNYNDDIKETWPHCNACKGCGRYQHGSSETNNCQWLCIAWGQTCSVWSQRNHFSKLLIKSKKSVRYHTKYWRWRNHYRCLCIDYLYSSVFIDYLHCTVSLGVYPHMCYIYMFNEICIKYKLSLSLYIYIYVCVCVCMHVYVCDYKVCIILLYVCIYQSIHTSRMWLKVKFLSRV